MQAIDWPIELERAAQRVIGVTRVTPMRSSIDIDRCVGASVLCKDEGTQITGSFKLRGAWNAMAAMDAGAIRRGVITYSSGNFGRALAHAARHRDVPCLVVAPDDTPDEKLAHMRGEGAEVLLHEPREDRKRLVRHESAARGMTIVAPYDDVHVIAGQGTVGRELMHEAPTLDAVVVPVSGGGLLAGCALAARACDSPVRVFGVEPAARPKTQLSLRRGRRETVAPRPTIADALRVTQPGVITFPIIATLAEDVLTVDDDELVGAMSIARDYLGVRCEPGAAAGLAAVLSGRLPTDVRRIGVVLSGSNIDPNRFERIVSTDHDDRTDE